MALFHVSVFVQGSFYLIYLARHLHFILFLCDTISLFFSDLNFTVRITSTASWSVLGYWLFLIVYGMERSCINSPYFLLSYPLIKTIFDHASNEISLIWIISSASYTSWSLLNSLVVLTKLSNFFSNWTLRSYFLLFKPLHVLHQYLYLLLPSISSSCKIFC